MKNNDKILRVVNVMCKSAAITCLVLVIAIFIASGVIEIMEDGVTFKTITTALISLGVTSVLIYGIVYIIRYGRDAQQEENK